MKHKPKGNPLLKQARRMMSQHEIETKVNPFDCAGWLARKAAKAEKVRKHIEKVQKRK